MANRQYEQFNCYLALDISPTSSPSEIKTAYRKASLRSHPDHGGSNAAQAKINVAYEVLSDPIQRQAHDIYWKISIRRDSAHPNQNEKSQEKQRAQSSRTNRPFGRFEDRLKSSIQSKKAEAWAELGSKTDTFAKRYAALHQEATNSFLWACGVGALSTTIAVGLPIFWIGLGISVIWATTKFGGTNCDGVKIPLFSPDSEKAINKQAEFTASKQCSEKAASYDKYISHFASVSELVARDSSFDDSEIQVVRRLVAALFLSGYTPVSYDSDDRIILLADGDERLMVRFRHRTGTAVNVSYVQKLVQLMKFNRVGTGLLFCSPGLSGNAQHLAKDENIKGYSLESMNTWIERILNSDRSGPSGSVIDNLDTLNNFLGTITPKFGRWNNRWRRR